MFLVVHSLYANLYNIYANFQPLTPITPTLAQSIKTWDN